MVIRNLLGGSVIMLSTIFLFENCNKHCASITAQRPVSLIGGFTLYNPIRDSINIGDTVFINITVPEKLTYSNNSSTIDFSNAHNVVPDISISALTGLQSQTGALDSFVLIKQVGSFYINSLLPAYSVNVTFDEKSGNYLFSAGCIAQKKGVYLILISDIPDAQKKCDYATISIVSSSSDSHLHYLKDIYYGGGLILPIDSTHSYCFKVY
jgi:hypothetical protein